jgi:hypothetical protein
MAVSFSWKKQWVVTPIWICCRFGYFPNLTKIPATTFSSKMGRSFIGIRMFAVSSTKCSLVVGLVAGGPNDLILYSWPPRSPDFTTCDFFFWGYVKDAVYVSPLPTTLDELKKSHCYCCGVSYKQHAGASMGGIRISSQRCSCN